MECNKEEAVRSKAIAENKLQLLDIEGAKKFALKAQSLFPKLDGISQFLEVINIHVENEKKTNGEVDYYKIFGVDPFVDEEILRKQYKRLALSLHPDKNKSVGADGAFKIMSQAWSVLSDKEKRRIYNMKLNVKAPNHKVSAAKKKPPSKSNSSAKNTSSAKTPTSKHDPTNANPPANNTSSQSVPTRKKTSAKEADSRKPTAPPATNTSSQSVPTHKKTSAKEADSNKPTAPPATNTSSQSVPTHKKTSAKEADSKNPTATDSQQQPGSPKSGSKRQQHVPNKPVRKAKQALKSETFWTSCERCKKPCKYLRIYFNKTLKCPECQQTYTAVEVTDPNLGSHSSGRSSTIHQQQGCNNIQTDTCASNEKRKTVNTEKGGESKKKTCNVTKKAESVSAPNTHSSGLEKEKPNKKRRIYSQKLNNSKEEILGNTGSRSDHKKTPITR